MPTTPQSILLAWIVATVSTLGSLFFSEVMKLPPCVLCWYQRIAIYPLVLILGVAWLKNDTRVKLYALPLVITGLLIAIYHNLLYYKILPESISPCVQGISCTTRQIEWLGFITIPLLSLGSFAVLALILTLPSRNRSLSQ
jgi:disulfide bond formation protein DsbB